LISVFTMTMAAGAGGDADVFDLGLWTQVWHEKVTEEVCAYVYLGGSA
jgi:hypothetical protein